MTSSPLPSRTNTQPKDDPDCAEDVVTLYMQNTYKTAHLQDLSQGVDELLLD